MILVEGDEVEVCGSHRGIGLEAVLRKGGPGMRVRIWMWVRSY